jgi:phosphomannomutase
VTLIKSISGIRGTIGNKPGEDLSPVDIIKFTAAFGSLLKNGETKIVIGRDGRTSGLMVRDIVVNTLTNLGIDVIDLGLSTTPTVEMAVQMEKAKGGIIITASHNPQEWNALKLLNSDGEFISAATGEKVLTNAEQGEFDFVDDDKKGSAKMDDSYLQKHIDAILKYPLVNAKAIAKQKFKVVVDAINSTGATFVPALLKELGVTQISLLNGEVNGRFAHNPEPLPEHLTELSAEVIRQKADFGIAVDPDVDRLCFVCEDGSMFGEEYTLVAIADYVLGKRNGNTVSNIEQHQSIERNYFKTRR